ncbi:MATE family efflux transporter [Haladaptatus paucihalophilus]|uniref:MATE family efflux transporter n=1 Tax=Haladaptatus paucihalophilus TaxID=367189 RepID=UPI000476238E|nr:MATE family efflux transporter [Haladaptatus paucihalophilus]
MLDVSRDEITNGSLVRALVLLAVPLVAQNLVQVAQQIVDIFWLGRLGETAVAAVGVNIPLTSLIFSVFMITVTGTQVLVSQRVGADELSRARRAVFHGMSLAFALGITMTVLVFVFGRDIIALFGAESAVASAAVTYLVTYSLGFPILGMGDAIEMGFVGWGDSRAALYINVVAVGINIVLDPILIFGLGIPGFEGFGIAGAALATILGYGCSSLFGLGMMIRGRDGFTLTREAMTFRLSDFRELFDIGFPMFGQRAAAQSVRVLIIAVVTAAGGPAAVSAYTIGASVASIAFIPASGLQSAAQSVIGQNIGAENPMRASRTTWVGVAIAAVGLSVIGVIQWFIPGMLTNLFVPNVSQATYDLTVDYLRILAYGYWGIGVMYLLGAGFNGASRTKTTMVADMVKYWGIRLPIAAVGVLWLGYDVHAVFWAVTLSNCVAAVGFGIYYYFQVSDGMTRRASRSANSSVDD